MNKNFKEQLEQYSVAIENLASIIDIAAEMASKAAWGSVSDDKDRLEKHMGRLVALMDSISEISHKRDGECDELIELLCKG